MAQRYAPLIDATMEIKLEATTAHLWFEEIISGDRYIDIKSIWRHLDEAEWYARAMLDGGENPEGKFLPVEAADLRKEVEDTIRGITAFREVARNRWKNQNQSGVGAQADQQFDRIFDDFIGLADKVETSLQREMNAHLKHFGILQGLLIALATTLGLITGVLINSNVKKIKESEEQYRLFTETTGVIPWEVDVDTFQFTYVGPQAEQLLGYPVEDWYQKDFWPSHIHPDDRDKTIASCLESTNKCQNNDFEYRMITADGRIFWLRDIIRYVSQKNSPGILRGVLINITDHKKIGQQLKEAKEMAEHANKAKSEFLAIMSHELRTPLNAINGFSEMMQMELLGSLGDQRYVEYAKDIHGAGEHLLRVINDVLDLSKIEAGSQELAEQELDIRKELGEAIKLVTGRAETNKIRLSLEIPDKLPRLFADRMRFKQMLLNILTNAIKFTPEEGRVSVVALQDEEAAILIKVKDTGIGISDENMTKVFLPFGQADDVNVRNQEGTGLGVPLTKSLMELHGGKLEIKSEVDAGTTATLIFPPERSIEI